MVTAERLVRETGIDPHRPFVCLHPGARWWFKSWPAERFAALADRIQQETHTPTLFLGSNQDKAMVSQIAGSMKTVHRNLAGRTGLQELAGVLKLASLMITNDNGPMHMAAAVKTPVVVLFALTNPPEQWRPWLVPQRLLERHAGDLVQECQVRVLLHLGRRPVGLRIGRALALKMPAGGPGGQRPVPHDPDTPERAVEHLLLRLVGVCPASVRHSHIYRIAHVIENTWAARRDALPVRPEDRSVRARRLR